MIFVYLTSDLTHKVLDGVKFPALVQANVLDSDPSVVYIDGEEVRRLGGRCSVLADPVIFFNRCRVSSLNSEFSMVVRPVKTIQDAPSSIPGPQFDFNLLYEARG